MPPKSGRNTVVNINPSELVMTCEWMECKETFQCMNLFTTHVTDHLTEHLSANQTHNPDQEESFACHWRECNTEVDGETSDYQRHVFFHTFHVKIKCIGALLTKKTGRNACTLGTQCRNLIPELPERLECGWDSCHQFYENAEMFYRHVENHTLVYPEGNQVKMGCRCQWEGCNVRVKSRYKLREHLRSHTQEKVVACPTCGNLFCSRTKYFDHVTRQMDVYTGKRYQCSHCNRTFPLEKILRDHMRNHVNHYKCPYCDMTMPSPASLRKHIRYRHNDDKPFKCEECDYSCKSAPDLKKHMEVHSKEGAYQCEMEDCSYSARSYSNLASHIKSVHQGDVVSKFQCHICDSNFTRGAKLTLHLKKNHKFSWPSGHSRFRYKLHADGRWRLQTVRYETVRLSDESEGPETSNTNTSSNDNTDENNSDDKDQDESDDIVIHIENDGNITCERTDSSEGESNTYRHSNKRRKLDKKGKEAIETDKDACKNTLMEITENYEPDNSMNMVELSITTTTDGKYLLKTGGGMGQPMTIMMADGAEEVQENTYNLQMLGDVALQNQTVEETD